jgi:ribose transport system permease protein
MNVWTAVLLAILACCASGLVSGLIVVYLRFSPIVSTLAINALLVGLVLLVTGGFAYTAAEPLVNFASGYIRGVPTILAIALVLVLAVAVTLRQTSVGRRLVATGVNQRAARAMGIPIRRYTICSYVAAGLCFAIVGVLLSGLLRIPGSVVGNTYLFTTFGAVVLGGSPLLGGEGSIVATAMGSLFLTQLNQMVLNAGGSTATQNLIQGGVIAISLLFGAIRWRSLLRLNRNSTQKTSTLAIHEGSEPIDQEVNENSAGGV